MATILLIEDDLGLLRVMELELRRHNYKVVTATNGIEGLRQFHDSQPDLVIMDVVLPRMDGVTVCQRIRELSNVPLVLMSAEVVEEEDIAQGLEIGADEYLRKPVGTVELVARVRALLRRGQLSDPEKSLPTGYSDDFLVVDVDKRRVLVDGEEQRLTPTEFKLLSTFVEKRGQVLTFQQLLETVWGYEYTTEFHYPRIYVSHLRRKIEPDAKNPTYIQNEYGVGYRFVGK